MRLGGTLVLISAVWLWLVYAQIPDAGAEWPGPRGFPLLLGIGLAALGAWMMAFPEPSIPDPGSRIPDSGSRQGATIALATLAMLVVYAFLLDKAGFLIATAALMVAAMAGVLQIRRWLFIGAFSAAFSLGSWAVFSVLLGIPLPRGTWLQR